MRRIMRDTKKGGGSHQSPTPMAEPGEAPKRNSGCRQWGAPGAPGAPTARADDRLHVGDGQMASRFVELFFAPLPKLYGYCPLPEGTLRTSQHQKGHAFNACLFVGYRGHNGVLAPCVCPPTGCKSARIGVCVCVCSVYTMNLLLGDSQHLVSKWPTR